MRKPDLKDDQVEATPSTTTTTTTTALRRESCDEMASSIERLAKTVSELGIGKEQQQQQQRPSLSKGK